MRLIVLGSHVAVVLLGFESGPAKADPLKSPPACETLRKIVSQASNDFFLLKGDQLEEKKWKVSYSIPGSKKCYVQRRERVSYECEMKDPNIPDSDDWRSSATSIRAQLADSIKECLGPSWTRKLNFEEFYSSVDDGNTTVMVNGDRDNMFDPPYVRVSVLRMFQAPMEPPSKQIGELKPGGYCARIKDTIEDAKASFTSATGDAEKNDLGQKILWKIRDDIPGWQSCYVSQWYGRPDCRYLGCKIGPIADQSQAEELLGLISSDLGACLGNSWKKNIVRNETGIGNEIGARSIRLVSRDQPVLELSTSKSFYSNETRYIDIYIRKILGCKR